jgi:hypothetical protein
MKKIMLAVMVMFMMISLAGMKIDKWSICNFNDEFGDKSDYHYLGIGGFGTFSNSATSSSSLMYGVYIVDEIIELRLFEYNRNDVAPYKNESYIMRVKDNNHDIHRIRVISLDGCLYIRDEEEFIDLCKINTSIKCYISIDRREYLFTVHCMGFIALYGSRTKID